MLKLGLNLYPPYIGAGVTVAHIAEDWSLMTVKLTLRWYNRNYVGTHFGGNLFAMTDPFYMLMLIHRLGRVQIVGSEGGDHVRKPGKGTVVANMTVAEEQLETIRAATVNGAKHFAEFDIDIVDQDGDVVATVHKTLYVREKPPKAQ